MAITSRKELSEKLKNVMKNQRGYPGSEYFDPRPSEVRKGQGLLVVWEIGQKEGSSWEILDKDWEPSRDVEPELDLLDEFLGEVLPGVSYLQYRKLMALVKRGMWDESDGYDTWTRHGYKILPAIDIIGLVGDWLGLPAETVDFEKENTVSKKTQKQVRQKRR